MPRYKCLGSAIHKFGSSFVSMMSWYDGWYTVDILAYAARRLELEEVVIAWWHGENSVETKPEVTPPAVVSERLGLALADYHVRLPRLFAETGAALDMLRWLRMRLLFDWNNVEMTSQFPHVPVQCVIEAKDDRGLRGGAQDRSRAPATTVKDFLLGTYLVTNSR